MSLQELANLIQDALDEGYGHLDVVIPSATGGFDHISDLDYDTLEEGEQILLS